MRRRQLFEARAREIMEEKAKETEMSIKVPNSNIVSKSAQADLKEKANMFLPHEKDIVKPNGTAYRKAGSKPGSGAKNKTVGKNIQK